MPTTGRRGSIGFGPRHLRSKLGKKKKPVRGFPAEAADSTDEAKGRRNERAKKKKPPPPCFLAEFRFVLLLFFFARALVTGLLIGPTCP